MRIGIRGIKLVGPAETNLRQILECKTKSHYRADLSLVVGAPSIKRRRVGRAPYWSWCASSCLSVRLVCVMHRAE